MFAHFLLIFYGIVSGTQRDVGNVDPNSSTVSSSDAGTGSAMGALNLDGSDLELIEGQQGTASDSHCKCQSTDSSDSTVDQRCMVIRMESVCNRRSQFCGWICSSTEPPTPPPAPPTPTVPELDMDGLDAFISSHWDDSIIPSLMDYIRLNFSSPANTPEGREAANLMLDWTRDQGIPGLTAELLTDQQFDAIWIEIPGSSNTNETIVIYGHYDKFFEVEGWTIGDNYDPVIQDGHLYGRGSADDAYMMYLVVSAVKGLLAVGGQYPRIIIFMDSAEELGDHTSSIGYLEGKKSEIGDISYMWIIDGGAGTFDRFWTEVSTKGIIMANWKCSSTEFAAHSGLGSGVVMDNLRIMRHILDRVENPVTGEMLLPEMGVIIPQGHEGIAEEAMGLIGDNIFMNWNFLPGVQPMGDDNLQRFMWNYYGAQLAVIAADIPSLNKGGNQLRPSTTLTLSIRLAPSADAAAALEALTQALTESDIPNNLICSVTPIVALDGWHLQRFTDFIVRETDEASIKVWGNQSAYRGSGGTSPLLNDIAGIFEDVLIMSFGVAHESARSHAENENVNITYAKQLTVSVSYLLHAHYYNFGT